MALAEDRSGVAAAELPQLAALIDEETSVVKGRLESPPAEDDLVVPAAAVFACETGDLHVLIDGRPPRSRGVEIVGGRRGVSVVRGELTVGESVVIAPLASDRKCE
jgi:threonine dehydrogenase-like Zn-dependent dehydrogenase